MRVLGLKHNSAEKVDIMYLFAELGHKSTQIFIHSFQVQWLPNHVYCSACSFTTDSIRTQDETTAMKNVLVVWKSSGKGRTERIHAQAA